jgi:hypothetical protein
VTLKDLKAVTSLYLSDSTEQCDNNKYIEICPYLLGCEQIKILSIPRLTNKAYDEANEIYFQIFRLIATHPSLEIIKLNLHDAQKERINELQSIIPHVHLEITYF